MSYQASGTTPTVTTIGTGSKTGSLWGLAYDRDNNRLFSSAVLKRHVGLGPSGLGAIYLSSPASAAPALFVTLPDVGTIVSNSSRGLVGTLTAPSRDDPSFDQVGKVGIGDIDISLDGKTLYAVNLAQRRVDMVDTATKAISSLPALPDPGCTNGVARPWGLKVYDGKVYLGLVCSAESSGGVRANLRAYLYQYDGSSWSSVITGGISLAYTRACSYEYGTNKTGCGGWNPWTSVHPTSATYIFSGTMFGYPTPLLADIEFDDDGSIILGFMDRTGLQYGYGNYRPSSTSTTLFQLVSGGDILRIHRVGSSYVVENNGASGEPTTTGKNNTQGPGGGEYYFGENYLNTFDVDKHYETSYGGMAILPGTRQVTLSALDPIATTTADNLDTNGLIWLSSTTGNQVRGARLNKGGNGSNGTFGKAHGVGDLELLCDPAPIEIGNLVWLDSDGDGIQDAGEESLAGVQVQLLSGSTVLATATTDANGNYYFSNASGTSTASSIYGISQLKPGLDYTVKFPASVSVSGTSYNLTTAKAGSNALIDSNAPVSGEATVLAVDIPVSGASNHSFDVGYAASTPVTHSIGNRVWFDSNNDGITNAGEQAVGAGIELVLKNSQGDVLQTTLTDVNGRYLFHGLSTGDYRVCVTAANFSAGSNLDKHRASTGQADAMTVRLDSIDRGDDDLSDGSCSTLFTLADNEPTSEQGITNQPDGDDGQGTADNRSNLTIDFGFVPPADVKLVKTADKTTTHRGDTVVYTLTLSNESNVLASGVKVTDELPTGVTVVNASASQGSFTGNEWDVGNMPANSNATLTLTVTIN